MLPIPSASVGRETLVVSYPTSNAQVMQCATAFLAMHERYRARAWAAVLSQNAPVYYRNFAKIYWRPTLPYATLRLAPLRRIALLPYTILTLPRIRIRTRLMSLDCTKKPAVEMVIKITGRCFGLRCFSYLQRRRRESYRGGGDAPHWGCGAASCHFGSKLRSGGARERHPGSRRIGDGCSASSAFKSDSSQ